MPQNAFAFVDVWSNIGAFVGIFFLALLVTILLLFARYFGKYLGAADSPLDILEKRYARGEITQAQFEAIKKDLRKNDVHLQSTP